MHTLSATELLDTWERGERQHPLDRALTLLAVTCPEKKLPELTHLSIGQRDALLLVLRQQTFGSQMEAYAECPACGAQLEFNVDVEELLRVHTPANSGELTADVEGFAIRFRLPDSVDLADCVNSGLLQTKGLLRRCVLEVNRGKERIDFEALPESAYFQLEARMAELDPLAEVYIALNCTECGHQFSMLLDILSFLWSELNEQVKRLLNQVHVLAQHYGWREADILAMSPWRRQYYLGMVT